MVIMRVFVKRCHLYLIPQIHYTRFPVTSPSLANRDLCRLVSDTAATSWQQVVVMEFGKLKDTDIELLLNFLLFFLLFLLN